MIKICAYCNTEFENNTKTTFCTRSCQTKSQWSKPGVKEEASKIQKEVQNRPEIKKKVSDGNKISQNKSDVKLATSKRMKKLWENEEFRSKMEEYYYREDVCKDHSDRMKEVMSRPEFKENIRRFQLEYGQLPEVKQFRSDIAKQLHNQIEYKEKLSNSMIKLWKNPIFANKMMKSSFKYKEYIMPSGRIVKIQGYEHRAITQLLKKYSENDILLGTELNKEVGRIIYVKDGIEHYYIPDLYIKSTNTIIEVKSVWTYESKKEKNELKKQACLDKGFNFEFMILSNKTNKN